MKPRWAAKWTFFVVLILSLASCSRNPDKYVASGDKYFKAGRFDEAAIQYRNAVQINPKLAQAMPRVAAVFFLWFPVCLPDVPPTLRV
jgi:hypothetical protein